MKLHKLMLTCAVAAIALNSCNKNETTPVGTNMKSVEFSLANVNFTKSETTNKIGENDAVNLASFQVFFADNAGNLYVAKNADNQTEAQDYFTAEDLTKNLVFHFLDPKVTKVVVLGNTQEVAVVEGTTKVADLEQTLAIATQQDAQEAASELTLYGEQPLTIKASNTVHTDANGQAYAPNHTVDVYQAKVTLSPRVARIEIVGYDCTFSAAPLYDKITIDQVAIDGYNSTAVLSTGVGSTLVDAVNSGSQVDVFNYFKTNQGTANVWWADVFETPVALTPEAPAATAPMLAYHVFPTAVPELLIDVTTTKDGVEMPAYLYTKGFATSNTATEADLKSLEAGKVYRLTLAFDDIDLTQQDKCVEVTVEVVDWVVVPVYPIF